ncbi:hypothetical protein [Lachnospira multipara]|uniref:hypothetical protein n=1 Tax=Lachnospira multipara TaxID=28051 RepID=UPI00040CC787|nr:hypothetical protein [Lachnospira multipara]
MNIKKVCKTNRMKRFFNFVFFPPVWFRCFFGFLSLTAVGAVFLHRITNTPFAYIAYLASALGAYYLITVTVILLARAVNKLLKNKYVRRYYEDKTFNARVILYRGAIINLLYAAFKFVTGVYYRSNWLIAIAVYYFLLIAVKVTLIHKDVRLLRGKSAMDELSEWRRYRLAGWLMLLFNIGLSGIVVQVVKQNKSFSYPGTIIFAIAAYSFYRITIAVIRVFKDRHDRGPILSAAKMIDLSFAVTAMFTLQTAMFSSFEPELNVHTPNIITGTAVALIITVIAVFMIIKSSICLKKKGN